MVALTLQTLVYQLNLLVTDLGLSRACDSHGDPQMPHFTQISRQVAATQHEHDNHIDTTTSQVLGHVAATHGEFIIRVFYSMQYRTSHYDSHNVQMTNLDSGEVQRIGVVSQREIMTLSQLVVDRVERQDICQTLVTRTARQIST